MDIVALPSDVGYNSYATIDEMDDIIVFLSTVFGDNYGWSDKDATAKSNLIILGSQSLYGTEFNGTLVDEVDDASYKMLFPRSGLTYPNGTEVPYVFTEELPTSGTPFEIKEYVGRWILKHLQTAISATSRQLTSKSVDGVSETYSASSRDMAADLIDPMSAIPSGWLANKQSQFNFGGIGSVGLTRYP